jgi:diguanylate cyclase (GGDEF)-like protein/PAS domain S-box-containing protein
VRLSPLYRISFGLAVVTTSLLVALDFFGFVPSPSASVVEARIQLCETLAMHAASAADRNDLGAIRSSLQLAVLRNEDVLSAGLRSDQGRILVAVGNHRELWDPLSEDRSTYAEVPLFRRGKPWATIEVRFAEIGAGGTIVDVLSRPLVRLVGLLGSLGFLAYMMYMRRTLRHLDPSAVIPTRVQAALDVMAESVLLLDPQERIVLANAAFAERAGCTAAALLGVKPSSFDWSHQRPEDGRPRLPWVESLRTKERCSASRLVLRNGEDETYSFEVQAVPVMDADERPRGVMVTLHDVTELDRRTAELQETLVELEKSQYEVKLQNEELEVLARRDPLTDVANRRAFMEASEPLFERAREGGRDLACVMADLDHFKGINDAHGHSAGDEVIRLVAQALSAEVGSADAVCRYGGEEFCMLLDFTGAAQAAELAERLRRRISSPAFARVPITASFGVSSMASRPRTLLELINQADEALYASKAGGRNRVTRWDEVGTARS